MLRNKMDHHAHPKCLIISPQLWARGIKLVALNYEHINGTSHVWQSRRKWQKEYCLVSQCVIIKNKSTVEFEVD